MDLELGLTDPQHYIDIANGLRAFSGKTYEEMKFTPAQMALYIEEQRQTLKEENIKEGVTIFDVTGTFKGAGGKRAYLTFSSKTSFYLSTYDAAKHWNGELFYSQNTKDWTSWDGSAIDAMYEESSGKYKLYICGEGNNQLNIGSEGPGWVLGPMSSSISTEELIDCDGDARCLLSSKILNEDGTPANFYPQMGQDCFLYLFQDCRRLRTPPTLPWKELVSGCYAGMFAECNHLEVVPVLEATKLAARCYRGMFRNCTAITTTPFLPAQELAKECYRNMFAYCTSLRVAEDLPATRLTTGCYQTMFNYCRSLEQPPRIAAEVLAPNCCAGMFMNCTRLQSLPALLANNLNSRCYEKMFQGCPVIKISTEPTDDTAKIYTIPIGGVGVEEAGAMTDMFSETGGSFTGTPVINQIYYTSNDTIGSAKPNLWHTQDTAKFSQATISFFNYKWFVTSQNPTIDIGGARLAGIYLVNLDSFENEKIYCLSYKFRKKDGDKIQIGGHMGNFQVLAEFLDGNFQQRSATPKNFMIDEAISDEEVHSIVVVTRYIDGQDSQPSIYIQPNCGLADNDLSQTTTEIWDLKLEQSNFPTAWIPAEGDDGSGATVASLDDLEDLEDMI